MELARIERYVSDRLEMSGINSQSVGLVVFTALRHVLTAVGIHERMSDEERVVFEHMRKETQQYFASKFNLKERKGSKEKKILPPNPLLKEKETKGKEQENPPTVCDAREAFRRECQSYVGQYGEQCVADFYRHWSEENPRSGKMRFQGKRYWNTETRLKRWMNNQYTIADEAAALRLQKQKKQGDAQERQQAVAQERTDANDRLEQEIAERKKKAITYKEWLASKEKNNDNQDNS